MRQERKFSGEENVGLSKAGLAAALALATCATVVVSSHLLSHMRLAPSKTALHDSSLSTTTS